MPLNFNVSPYNDDFSADKHFYRILFRPSVAVQARELTQTQSILQNQISFFADSVWKHGQMVVPGQIATDPKANYVALQPTYGTFNGTPIPINLELFANQQIRGDLTGMTAQVVFVAAATATDPPTLYVKYLDGGTSGNSTEFTENENISIVGTVTTLAQTAAQNAAGLGASAQIQKGVYYVFGFFVQVESQYLVLNKYSNVVNSRVGIQINESVITSDDDPTLNDNAQGSPNYAAPGAHRYKIDLVLTQKSLTDTSDDTNFVELIRLVNSVRQTVVAASSNTTLMTEIAARTSDTSGDFTVRPFAIDIREHLDTSFVTKDTVVAATNVVGPTEASVTLAQSASSVDGAYEGMTISITNGPGAGEVRTIVTYVGATKTASVDSDWDALKLPTTESAYLISDLTKVNRGIYPPAPFGPGDATKLAVGMEPGRAYVDGFLIDTLSTNYVDVDKARDTTQVDNSVVPAPVGNYLFVKNLINIPLAAASVLKNYLTISLSNKKSTGSFNSATDEVGTAQVHAIEYFEGSGQSATDAIFKLYLFNVKMNVGQLIGSVRSFFLTNNFSTNNNGNSLNAWGDVMAVMKVSNVNGTGFVPSATLVGPNGVGSESIVLWDSLNNLIYTEPIAGNPKQILTTGSVSVAGGSTAQLTARTQLFDPSDAILIYPLSQSVVKSVTSENGVSDTTYYTRRMFEATRNSSGQYVFNTNATEPFAPFNTTDYMACVVQSSNSGTVGAIIGLQSLISSGNFSGAPANTVLSFSIPSGPGSAVGDVVKLMGTVIKETVTQKSKTLVSTSLAVVSPTASFSLGKADIVAVTKIIDSGNPAIPADETDPAMADITIRYTADTGQRDYFYGVGRLSLRQGAPPPVGRLKVFFQYFSHSGTGDYFSVDSYANQVGYTEIPTYMASNGQFYPLRDCLDFRPRIDDSGITFSGTGSSFSEAVRPNDVVRADFSYYLGRIDKIYVDENGKFLDIRGSSSLTPLPPANPQNGMLLYTLQINPYTSGPTDVKAARVDNRGYTMADIGKLETRIANLEYYTSLNLLEQDTAKLQITDTATGLDRFKNGFIVDNFKGHGVGDVFDGDYKCSMDLVRGELRPMYLQDSTELQFNAAQSLNYRLNGDVLFLPYTEKTFITQPFATETMRVNPFAIFSWLGDVTLLPSTDSWKDTAQRPDVLQTDDSALDNVRYSNYPQGTSWGDWQTDWVGVPTDVSTQIDTTKAGTAPGASFGTEVTGTRTGAWVFKDGTTSPVGTMPSGETFADLLGVSAEVAVTDLVTSSRTVQQSRTGIRTSVVPQVVQVNISNKVLSISYYPFIRSRRINIVGKHLKPMTRVYPFFDGVNVAAYCQPYSDPALTPQLQQAAWTQQTITWGVSVNSATNANSGTTTQMVTDPGKTGTFYCGQLNDPLFTDGIGTITLFFTIPDDSKLKFRTGRRQLTLTSNAENDSGAETQGSASYVAQGILETDQKTITSVREPKVVQEQVTGTQTITETTVFQTTKIVQGWVDPLAETFLVNCTGGAFISKVDLFFNTIDDTIPVTVQIRTVVNGYPGPQILPFAEKTLSPSNKALCGFDHSYTNGAANTSNASSAGVQTSDTGLVPTSFVFDTPVYVQDNTSYCLVVMANSSKYTAFVARLGDKVLGSNATVSTQPYAGVLFMSQNGSTWTADQNADLKFTIYRASFDPTSTGIVYLSNLDVVPTVLGALPFETTNGSNTVRVWHQNHMMPKGTNTQSVVTLSNIASGTYNGLTSGQLTGTFLIDNITLNSYTISVAGAPASSTSRVGPDGVIATQNRQYDSLTGIVSTNVLQGTNVDFALRTISGKSPDNNVEAIQEPYQKDSSFAPFVMNRSTDFDTPRMIASNVNETTNVGGTTAFARKSLLLQGTMSTTVENLTPMIDTTRISVVTVNSLIDDPTFANRTIQGMDAGFTVTATSSHTMSFASQTVFALVGVTGTTFTPGNTVTGLASGATATVVSWDSLNLTVSNTVIGVGDVPFEIGEALQGPTAIGTIQNISVVNTITNPDALLDFSGFKPGRGMTIANGTVSSNQRAFNNPVTVLDVTGNVITVDCGPVNFVTATGDNNVVLTQYNRFVSEVAPTGCSVSARYITRAFTLQAKANGLTVLFTVNRPPGSFVDCYYRTLKADTNDVLSNQLWTLMTLDDAVDNGESTDPTEFKEYSYTANAIAYYTALSIKIVMRGGNSSQVPVFQDFRAIALGT